MGTSSCFEINEKIDKHKQKERLNITEEERKETEKKKAFIVKGERNDNNPNKKIISQSFSEKLYSSIVRINLGQNEKEAISVTGFFIKLILNNKTKHFLITCHHAINEKLLEKHKTIKLHYGKINDEKNIEIKLDKNKNKREIKYFKNSLDVTLIEILEEDKINEDNYLQPDIDYKKEGYNSYTNNNNYYYLVGYLRNNERTVSSGQITEILEKPEFKHSLDDTGYNSGAPICLANNLFVVGIHKQGDKGIFLGYILDNLEKEEEKKGNNEKLLENIQSMDINRKIFYYLDEKIKLKIIKYNNKIKKNK